MEIVTSSSVLSKLEVLEHFLLFGFKGHKGLFESLVLRNVFSLRDLLRVVKEDNGKEKVDKLEKLERDGKISERDMAVLKANEELIEFLCSIEERCELKGLREREHENQVDMHDNEDVEERVVITDNNENNKNNNKYYEYDDVIYTMKQSEFSLAPKNLLNASLVIQGGKIKGIKATKSDKALVTFINNKSITDIDYPSFSKEFPFLRYLYLADNLIQRIPASLSKLNCLRVLDLQGNFIRDIDNLTLPLLESINLSDNALDQLSGLSELKSLKKALFANQRLFSKHNLVITSLPSSIEELDLEHNLIKDIKILKNLDSLKILKLNGNLVSDLEGLCDVLGCLKELLSLEIKSNPVCDVKGFRDQIVLCNGNINELNGIDIKSNERAYVSYIYNRVGLGGNKCQTQGGKKISKKKLEPIVLLKQGQTGGHINNQIGQGSSMINLVNQPPQAILPLTVNQVNVTALKPNINNYHFINK